MTDHLLTIAAFCFVMAVSFVFCFGLLHLVIGR